MPLVVNTQGWVKGESSVVGLAPLAFFVTYFVGCAGTSADSASVSLLCFQSLLLCCASLCCASLHQGIFSSVLPISSSLLCLPWCWGLTAGLGLDSLAAILGYTAPTHVVSPPLSPTRTAPRLLLAPTLLPLSPTLLLFSTTLLSPTTLLSWPACQPAWKPGRPSRAWDVGVPGVRAPPGSFREGNPVHCNNPHSPGSLRALRNPGGPRQGEPFRRWHSRGRGRGRGRCRRGWSRGRGQG